MIYSKRFDKPLSQKKHRKGAYLPRRELVAKEMQSMLFNF